MFQPMHINHLLLLTLVSFKFSDIHFYRDFKKTCIRLIYYSEHHVCLQCCHSYISMIGTVSAHLFKKSATRYHKIIAKQNIHKR